MKTTPYYYLDGYNFCLVNEPPDYGRGDATKRSFLYWYVHKKWEVGDAIMQNYKLREPNNKGCANKIEILRHPEITKSNISRDHVIFRHLLLHYRHPSGLKLEIQFTPWKLSDKYSQTIDMWLWDRALVGNHLCRLLFYTVMIPQLLVVAFWNNFTNLIAGFHKEFKPEDYKPMQLTRWQGIWSGKRRYPIYALEILAWQLKVLPRGPLRRISQLLACLVTPRYNYMIKLLLNHPIRPTEEQVLAYKPMTQWRWSTKLNETNSRNNQLLPDVPGMLDKDLLLTLYNETL